MAKNILRDIMTSERKSIRQVPLPRSRKSATDSDTPVETDILYENEEITVRSEGAARKNGSWMVWSAAVIFLIAMSIALIASFSGATVTVTAKNAEVSVTGDFVAFRSQVGKNQPEGLTFEAAPLSKTGEIIIPAPETKRVSEKASGIIIVYNNFGSKSQRLIKNTRFESQAGAIYRIDRSIVVPGQTAQNGKTVPGSIEAVVYADSPGVEYNSEPTDFTIPGFKTDPARYKAFYARSKTPITGGIDGFINAPSAGAEEKAREALRSGIEKELMDLARRSIPEERILFDNAFAFSFDSLPLESKGTDKAVVREKANGAAFTFKRSDMAKAIAVAALPSYNGLPVEVPALSKLSFDLVSAAEKNPETTVELKFKLAGTARVVWLFEEGKLRDALIGRPKIELAGILAAFPTIEKVDVTVRPFWKRSFPDSPQKINIRKNDLQADE